MKACWNACIAEGSFLRLTKNLAIFFQHFKFPCFSESNFYRLQSVSIAFHLCKESKILSIGQGVYFHFCFFMPATGTNGSTLLLTLFCDYKLMCREAKKKFDWLGIMKTKNQKRYLDHFREIGEIWRHQFDVDFWRGLDQARCAVSTSPKTDITLLLGIMPRIY